MPGISNFFIRYHSRSEKKIKKIKNSIFFKKDLNRVRPGKVDYRDNKPLKLSGSSPLEIEAAKEWKKYLEKNRSIVVDLFQVFFIKFINQ